MSSSPHKLHVLVVSHAAVIPVNQEPFDALARGGAEVTLVAPRSLHTDLRGRVEFAPMPHLAARAIALPISVGGYRRLLGGQRGIHLIVYRGLARIVASERPDVVFVEEEPHSLSARQVARTGARFVVHENQNIARRLPPPFGAIRRGVLARAAGVTVRNENASDLIRAEGFTGPIGSFPHAVDLAREGTHVPLGLSKPVVGFVGRIVEEKGIFDLVDALEGSTATLLVVGDGPARAAAEERAIAKGVSAHFTGAIAHDRMQSVYPEMDVVAIPSRTTPTWKEQFGRIVIEANGAGVPVVVSDSGELQGTAAATAGGVVVPEGDVRALRAAIADLLGNDEKRGALGAAGRASVAADFTPVAVARRLYEFLEKVCA